MHTFPFLKLIKSKNHWYIPEMLDVKLVCICNKKETLRKIPCVLFDLFCLVVHHKTQTQPGPCCTNIFSVCYLCQHKIISILQHCFVSVTNECSAVSHTLCTHVLLQFISTIISKRYTEILYLFLLHKDNKNILKAWVKSPKMHGCTQEPAWITLSLYYGGKQSACDGSSFSRGTAAITQTWLNWWAGAWIYYWI